MSEQTKMPSTTSETQNTTVEASNNDRSFFAVSTDTDKVSNNTPKVENKSQSDPKPATETSGIYCPSIGAYLKSTDISAESMFIGKDIGDLIAVPPYPYPYGLHLKDDRNSESVFVRSGVNILSTGPLDGQKNGAKIGNTNTPKVEIDGLLVDAAKVKGVTYYYTRVPTTSSAKDTAENNANDSQTEAKTKKPSECENKNDIEIIVKHVLDKRNGFETYFDKMDGVEKHEMGQTFKFFETYRDIAKIAIFAGVNPKNTIEYLKKRYMYIEYAYYLMNYNRQIKLLCEYKTIALAKFLELYENKNQENKEIFDRVFKPIETDICTGYNELKGRSNINL